MSKQRSYQHPPKAAYHVWAMHHVGLHGLGCHGQGHGERLEHRAVPERPGRSSDLSRGRVTAYAQGRAGHVLVAEAPHLDPSAASQGPRQLIDHNAHPAIDVGRVLPAEHQNVHNAPVVLPIEAV